MERVETGISWLSGLITQFIVVYAGGKMWMQGNNHYVHLLCCLGSTDVNYIITRWFLL